MFRSCLLVLLFITHSCCGQGVSASSQFNQFKRDVLEELRIHHGGIGMDYDTRETYYTLLSSQPIDSLIGFTDDSVAAIRAEIFAGLILKGLDDETVDEILKRHAQDTAKFMLMPTDVHFKWSVFSYMKFNADMRAEIRSLNVDLGTRLEELKKRRSYNLVPGARHGFIRKDSLLKLTSLNSPIEGFRITSFKLSILKAGEDLEELSESDGTFTKQLKERIATLSSRDRIFIEDVKAKGSDNKERQLGSIVLTID